MFPKNFYINERVIKVQKTAEPTGILGDPMDLLGLRPWLKIDSENSGESTEKKYIIFADHLFKYRDAKIRESISLILLDLYEDQFKIYIVEGDGEYSIADDYSLSLDNYSNEYIYDLVLKEFSLPANEIVILDYWGVNELIEKPRNLIDYNEAMNEHFFKLIASTQLNTFELCIRSENFLALDPQKIAEIATKIVSISIDFSCDESQLGFIFQNFSGIAKLKIGNTNDLMRAFNKLPDNYFKNLYEMDINNNNGIPVTELIRIAPEMRNLIVTNAIFARELPDSTWERIIKLDCSQSQFEDFGLFLKKVINIEELIMTDCTGLDIPILDLPENHLAKLKNLYLGGPSIPYQTFNTILNAATNLKEIQGDNINLEKGFSNIKTKLTQLKEVSLSASTLYSTDIMNLINAAPQLEELNLSSIKCPAIAFCFLGLKTPDLKNLRTLDMSATHISMSDLYAILSLTANLTHINISNCGELRNEDNEDEITDLAPGILPSLVEFRAENIIFSVGECRAIVAAAPNLEIFQLPNVSITNSFFKTLTPNQLPRLREICAEPLVLSTNGFACLMKAATNLEVLRIQSYNSSLKDFFSAFAPNQLKNLKEFCYIGAPGSMQMVTETSLEKFFRAAPYLKIFRLEKCSRDKADAVQGVFSFQPRRLTTLELAEISDLKTFIVGLLWNALNLIEIKLTSCGDLSGAKEILEKNHKRHHLYFLKKFIYTNTYFSTDDLERICKMAPGLKEIIGNNSISEQVEDTYFNTDLDIENKLKFYRYFPDVPPHQYRLRTSYPDMNTLQIFSPFPALDFNAVEINPQYAIDDEVFCGGIDVTPYMPKQIILPSLSAQEKLIALAVYDKKRQLIPAAQYALKYSASSHFYQLCFEEQGYYRVNFKVAVSTPKTSLPAAILAQMSKYQNFVPKPVSSRLFRNLREAANYFKEKNTGSCRLRVLPAYDELKSVCGDDVCIVYNDLHAFIELKYAGHYHHIDLGGYPCASKEELLEAFKLAEDTKEEVLTENQEIENQTLPMPLTALKDIPVYFSDLTDSKPEQENFSLLAIANSDYEVRDFYAELYRVSGNSAEDIFIINSPEDINLSGQGMSLEGKLLTEHTRLGVWLKGRQRGNLCVNMLNFSDKIAQLNDLLERSVENTMLPPGINIIILTLANQTRLGQDFIRRVSMYTTLKPASSNALLPAADNCPVLLEIDLYDSLFWQGRLAGNWELTQMADETDLSFRWQKGLLAQFLLTKGDVEGTIIFKNPPVDDLKFRQFVTELQSLKRFHWADQTYSIPKKIIFLEKRGFDWATLASNASIHLRTEEEKSMPYILSDSNILSFVNTTCFEFSAATDQLHTQPSYFQRSLSAGVINIMCAPGLSQGTLAYLLTEAKKINLAVRFLAPALTLPKNSVLQKLQLPVQTNPADQLMPVLGISWVITDDVYFSTRAIISYFNKTYPTNINYFDFSALEAADLGRYTYSLDELKNIFLQTGKLRLFAKLSAICQKLLNKGKVLLSGKIPAALYPALTALATGNIEGRPFDSSLYIITSPAEAPLLEALLGTTFQPRKISGHDKINYLHEGIPDTISKQKIIEYLASKPAEYFKNDYATVEREFLQDYYTNTPSFNITCSIDFQFSNSLLNDNLVTKDFEKMRKRLIDNALKISPWAMVLGDTGVGKSTFFAVEFSPQEIFYDIKLWLQKMPAGRERIILIRDEANISDDSSQLKELALFKSLPAGIILWENVIYSVTPQHKVVYIFNNKNYGHGRSGNNILSEHALNVYFGPIPPEYVRARIIYPALCALINNSPHIYDARASAIMEPLVQIIMNFYFWISARNTPGNILITMREIKLIANLLVCKIKNDNLVNNNWACGLMAHQLSYLICKQTLVDHIDLLKKFEKDFGAVSSLSLQGDNIPAHYADYQQDTYTLIKTILDAIVKTGRDVGLGGIIFEGASAIGKTYFIKKFLTEYALISGKKFYQISPTTPYGEKKKLLAEAFENGCPVMANEFNTALWPNKLLNNYLMGVNEHNKPAAKAGFFLFISQNAASLSGRFKEDPAIRRRVLKLKLDWPVYGKGNIKKRELEVAQDNCDEVEEKTCEYQSDVRSFKKTRTAYIQLNYFSSNAAPMSPLAAEELEFDDELLMDTRKIS